MPKVYYVAQKYLIEQEIMQGIEEHNNFVKFYEQFFLQVLLKWIYSEHHIIMLSIKPGFQNSCVWHYTDVTEITRLTKYHQIPFNDRHYIYNAISLL